MFKIPLVPQWNLNNGCVCTPDGGFLYAGSRSINFISSIESDNEKPKIECFHTRQGILSLDVDPHWGQVCGDSGNEDVDLNENLGKNVTGGAKRKEPAKLFVALLQDNSVQIWDFNRGCAIQGHKAHLALMRYMEGNGPSPQHSSEVLISYMCNRNVLSVDSQDIVVYCVASNSFYRRPMFISSRNHQVTSLKCSPYNENQFAVGTKRGLVLLCDLQKMITLYTLRGHDTSITSLSWNRVNGTYEPVQAEKSPDAADNKAALQKKQSNTGKLCRSDATIDADDIFDIYDYDYLDNEFGAPSHEMKIKNDFVSDFVGIENTQESSTTAKFDFAEACQSLKEEINALRDEQANTSLPENIISLEDCKQATKSEDNLSSCGSDYDDEADDKGKDLSLKDSSDGSVVRLACHTPSSEDSVDVDGMIRNKNQNIICQAEVHSSQSQDNNNELQHNNNETLERHSTDDDIQIISNTTKSTPDKKEKDNEIKICDILLASASADGTFSVWNTKSGATCDTHKVRSSNGGKNNHIEISWISATSIIINNKAGELQMWSIQPLTQHNQLPQHCDFRLYKFKETKRHWSQRSVISFGCSLKQQIIWCISYHREVSMEDIKENQIKLNYSCVSTNIGAMQECPDDMNKIALGFSDRRIGIIDISKMTPTSVHIENFVHRIESTVMSLVWSPDCKKLAYGTMEGRIGIINIESSNKQLFTFNSISGKPIYSISWQNKFVYVVCNDRIAVYEDDPNKKDPYVMPDIDNVACISLRNNYLFVGTQNGQLRLYAQIDNSYFKYEFKTSMDLAPRYICQISWSPIVTNKLAVVANANIIHILEFNDEAAELQIKHKIEINAPKAANSCCKWSNRNENHFLTCGFDGAVRVWDLSNDKHPEQFCKIYHCPLSCGLFLPTDEEIILCSGKSAALEVIDMRVEKSESNVGKSKRSNPRTLDTVQWATKAITRNEAKSQAVDKKQSKRLAKNSEADVSENKVAVDGNAGKCTASSEEVLNMLDKLHLQNTEGSLYMKNPVTLLYLTTKEINKDALDLMFSMLSTQKPNENKSLSAKLFGTKSEAKEVLKDELKNHQKSEIKGISSLFMPQLNGNLKDEILKCVQSKQLCEWHVSLAPSVSYSFWQKCCQAYAEQLIEQGYALQAAAYMLAIHQQQDAIEMLMEKKLFKEALLIARIYLQPEDSLNNKIAEQWITHLYSNGNLTGAALLCLLTKQNNRAYECLVKIRNTVPEIERIIRLLKSADIPV